MTSQHVADAIHLTDSHLSRTSIAVVQSWRSWKCKVVGGSIYRANRQDIDGVNVSKWGMCRTNKQNREFLGTYYI
jgi:hypothetical protein